MRDPQRDQREAEIAETIARLAHYGQTTQSEGVDFIMHPAWLAAHAPAHLKAAAWLHDVLEDSSFTAAHLRAAGISQETIDIVEIVTRRNETYVQFIERIAASRSPAAIAVKLLDLRHNLRLSCPPELRRRYEFAVSVLLPHASLST